MQYVYHVDKCISRIFILQMVILYEEKERLVVKPNRKKPHKIQGHVGKVVYKVWGAEKGEGEGIRSFSTSSAYFLVLVLLF
jgi:hypothetical protein